MDIITQEKSMAIEVPFDENAVIPRATRLASDSVLAPSSENLKAAGITSPVVLSLDG